MKFINNLLARFRKSKQLITNDHVLESHLNQLVRDEILSHNCNIDRCRICEAKVNGTWLVTTDATLHIAANVFCQTNNRGQVESSIGLDQSLTKRLIAFANLLVLRELTNAPQRHLVAMTSETTILPNKIEPVIAVPDITHASIDNTITEKELVMVKPHACNLHEEHVMLYQLLPAEPHHVPQNHHTHTMPHNKHKRTSWLND